MGKFPLGGVAEFSVDDIPGQRRDEREGKFALGFQIPKSVMGGGIFFLQPASNLGIPDDDNAFDFTETRKPIGGEIEETDTRRGIFAEGGDRADQVNVVGVTQRFAEAVDDGIRGNVRWLDNKEIRFHGWRAG